jgi:hypothetical protein
MCLVVDQEGVAKVKDEIREATGEKPDGLCLTAGFVVIPQISPDIGSQLRRGKKKAAFHKYIENRLLYALCQHTERLLEHP